MSKVVVEDKRIYLRKLEITDDLSRYLVWINDEEMNKYLSKKPRQTLKDLKLYIESHKNNYLCGIFNKDEDYHLGNVLVSRIDKANNNCHIGIFVGKESWGKGIGTSAVNLLTNYMLDTLGFHKVTAGVARENVGSSKLFLKCGYNLEFTSKDEFRIDGEYMDHLYYTKYSKLKKIKSKQK